MWLGFDSSLNSMSSEPWPSASTPVSSCICGRVALEKPFHLVWPLVILVIRTLRCRSDRAQIRVNIGLAGTAIGGCRPNTSLIPRDRHAPTHSSHERSLQGCWHRAGRIEFQSGSHSGSRTPWLQDVSCCRNRHTYSRRRSRCDRGDPELGPAGAAQCDVVFQRYDPNC